jgi:hypothetical protein
VGKNKDQTKQTTGSMPRESSQVGTHGQTGSDQGYQGQDSWKQGDPTTPSQGAWNDPSQRDFQGGDATDPAQPSGTSPLDKDQQPVNQNRPVQQNR